jgi:putative tryptophan/tyrosine transport system substrate-binding protein
VIRRVARRGTGAALLIGVLIGGAPAAAAPPDARMLTVGYLANEPTLDSLPVLRAGLRERGWIEGRSLEIQPRYGQGKPELYAPQADELARLNIAVIVAVGVPAIEAARRATKTIPIVMISPDDPAAAGLTGDPATSSNLTGLTTFVPELSARRLELLRQIMPGVTRVATLWNPASASAAVDLKATQAAAQAQNVALVPFELKGDSDVREIFVKIKEQRAQAVIVLADALTLARRETIATAASRNGLPSVFALRDFVDAGGLISYGATWTDVFGQAAGLVDRILRGARPADLPVARASRFELIVNLRAARAIPVPIPLPLLRRADRVIQ